MTESTIAIYLIGAFFAVSTVAVIVFTIRSLFFPRIEQRPSDPGIELREEIRQAVAKQQPKVSKKTIKDWSIHALTMSFVVVFFCAIYGFLIIRGFETPEFLEAALTLVLGYYFGDKAARRK